MADVMASIKCEFGLDEQQATLLTRYAWERYATSLWADIDSERHTEMSERVFMQHAHTASALEDVAQAMWDLDVDSIYNELARAEREDLVRRYGDSCLEKIANS